MSPSIKPLIAAVVVSSSLALAGCSSSADDATTSPSMSQMSTATSSMSATSDATIPATATFSGLNGKKVSGTVTVTAGKVELSDFSSDEGPDLHLYLTTGTDEKAVSAGRELGKVVFNQANQTFTIPAGVDTATFSQVVVHCDKAKAVFGAAALSS